MKKTCFCIIYLFVVLFDFHAAAQQALPGKDTLIEKRPQTDKITLLTYVRAISDNKGNIRVDENIVGNFKLINWLKLEAGIRQGERPKNFDSYYHYKLELQTKSFLKILRIIARVSDNVINYPVTFL
jgi:hypothetical protein